MRQMLASIEGEWRRYKILGDRALQQVRDNELGKEGPSGGNSIAIIVAHVAGNLKSRFTDFVTADGEKSWRVSPLTGSKTHEEKWGIFQRIERQGGFESLSLNR